MLNKFQYSQDSERQQWVDRRISDLHHKQSELSKVDVLEQKIKNELASLDDEMQTVQESHQELKFRHDQWFKNAQWLTEEETSLNVTRSQFPFF